MSTTTGYSYDPSTLAWEGDRASYLALDPEARRLVDGIAKYLEHALQHDTELHEGCHSSETCERGTELLELRNLQGAVSNALGADAIWSPESFNTALEERLEKERAEGEKDATIPSRANTAERKAMRHLLEGRLEVVKLDPEQGLIHARLRSTSGKVYDLGYDPRPGQRRWRCTCEEMRGDCSHLKALQFVTTVPIPNR